MIHPNYGNMTTLSALFPFQHIIGKMDMEKYDPSI